MNKQAIKAEHISKRYTIGMPYHDTLRDAAASIVKHALTRSTNHKPGNSPANIRPAYSPASSPQTIWALQDVSFEIQQGEVVGIIGRNGAGKTTLLKILSRITEPTGGKAIINGRIGSLLDVGTGFHPELTGRENIYLNGAILGMTRREITRKFDAITSFAEIGKFLDTPVKRYSSGMYVRLAFAVAAHLEPEILLVDEVLAVGDIAFQKKCLGKIGNIAKEGRTVVFVSHNMGAIQRLCSKTMLIQKGKLTDFGPTADILEKYITETIPPVHYGEWIDVGKITRKKSNEAWFSKFRFCQTAGTPGKQLTPNMPLQAEIVIRATHDQFRVRWAMFIADLFGTKLLNFDSARADKQVILDHGENHFTLTIPRLPLKKGTYKIGLWMAQESGIRLDFVHDVTVFDVHALDENYLGSRRANDGIFICDYQIEERHSD